MKHLRHTRILVLGAALIAFAALTPGASGGPRASGPSFVDATGTRVELSRTAKRVVCVTEPCVDAMIELGLRPVAVSPNGISALPAFLGKRAASVPKVGGSFFEPSIEDIVAARPDLVVGLGGVHDGLRKSLGGIPLYIVLPKTPEQSVAFLRDLGRLTGRVAAARRAAARFTSKLRAATARPRKDVTVALVQAGGFGFNIDATGQGSVYAALVSRVVSYPFAKADAAKQESGFGRFSIEQLLAEDPDVIFVASLNQSGGQGKPSSVVFSSDPIWNRLTAVREGRVVDVRSAVWLYGRGTRSLGIVLEELRRNLP